MSVVNFVGRKTAGPGLFQEDELQSEVAVLVGPNFKFTTVRIFGVRGISPNIVCTENGHQRWRLCIIGISRSLVNQTYWESLTLK